MIPIEKNMLNLNKASTLKRVRNRYRLVISNDDTFEEIGTFKLNRYSLYLTLSTIFLAIISFTVLLIVFTPMKYYIPGYGNIHSKTELELLKIQTDSLQKVQAQNDQYLNNIKKVLNGNITELREVDSPIEKELITVPSNSNSRRRKRRQSNDLGQATSSIGQDQQTEESNTKTTRHRRRRHGRRRRG